MANLGSLLVKVGADISQYASAMNEVGRQAANAASKVKKEFAGIQKLADNLSGVGKSLSAAFTIPFVALGLSL